ncbi:hybrid sensor histidine kinase/response regulator [Sneathiella limimaris]|uniref:PAS domain-containing hybrid sensor histidine kinase/response regulator n=1 Tax=Sneathiella limimaris TaxID=1964213 RepID=UPI00146B574D|nr:PAS domain-containing sensor histidine kinase [Sneathiella limimaris]
MGPLGKGFLAFMTDQQDHEKEAEPQLEHNFLFQNLMDGAAIAVVITWDGEFLLANEYAHEVYDMQGKSLIGMKTADFHPDREEHEKFVALIESNDRVKNYRMNMLSAKGNLKTLLFTTSRGVYKGKPAYYTVLQDFTELVQSQKVLQDQRSQHREVLELIPDGLLIQVGGVVRFVNHSALQTFGLENKTQIIGTPSNEWAAPRMRQKMLDLRSQLERDESTVNYDSWHRRLDGSEFPTHVSARTIVWEGEVGTLNIIRDMSHTQKYMDELHRKDHEMELAQEVGQMGHWRIVLDGLKVTWSRSLYEIHGMDPDKDVLTMDKAVSRVFPSDRKIMMDAINNAIRTKAPTQYEVRLRLGDGEIRYMAGKIIPEMNEDGWIDSVFGVSLNVTEQRLLEDKLRQSQKMEAVGQLTGGIAHDFNNLLAIIQGNAELLLEENSVPGLDRNKMLNSMIAAADRGAELTRNMLAFARDQRLDPVVSSLKEPVLSTISMLRRTIEEEISILTELEDDPWNCRVDLGQLENALINLVLNARDAMPKGGDITISLENSDLASGLQVTGEYIPAGQYVVLSVADTGMGIEPSKLAHVFEPFFTTKEVGRGTGLGLSMVYGFIKQSAGYVTVQSELSEGTCLSLYLPRIA